MSPASPQAVGDVPHAAADSLRHPECVCCLQDPGLGTVRDQEGVVVAEVRDNVRALTALAIPRQKVRDDTESLPGAPPTLQSKPEQVHPQEPANQVMIRVAQNIPNRFIANHDSFLEISLDVGILFLVAFY